MLKLIVFEALLLLFMPFVSELHLMQCLKYLELFLIFDLRKSLKNNSDKLKLLRLLFGLKY